MEVFGMALTVGNCLMALVVIATTYLLVEWLQTLAWRRRYNLKGPFPLPFLGTFYTMFSKISIDEAEKRNFETYGKLTAGSLGSIYSIHIADIELLKKIFVKEHVQFQNRYSLAGVNPPPLDKGLLALRDEEWKRVRSIVTPTFSPGKLKLMTKEINYCADLLVKSFLEKADTQEPVDVRHHMGCYSMDVIAGTAFGIRTHAYTNPDQPFVHHAQKEPQRNRNATANFVNIIMTSTVAFSETEVPRASIVVFFPKLSIFLTQWFGVHLIYPKESIKFFVEVLDTIMEERRETDQTERVDMIALLMAAQANEESGSTNTNKRMSRDELMAVGFIAFVAGYDTTSSFLSFFAYVMSTHPGIQEKLMKEIETKFPTDDVDVKYDDVSDMPYLDQVICETLRMYPPILRMNRITSHERDVELDGYWFPRNTLLQYSIWQVHYNMGFYEEPDKFKPERFSPEEKQKRDPFTFMPFGHGPRNCIGMRLALLTAKIAVIHVMKKLKFVRCAVTEEPLELIHETFLRPKRPIKVEVQLHKKE